VHMYKAEDQRRDSRLLISPLPHASHVLDEQRLFFLLLFFFLISLYRRQYTCPFLLFTFYIPPFHFYEFTLFFILGWPILLHSSLFNMTSSHSRSRSTLINADPYLQPRVRQRAVSSSGAGSPHSFTSNLAVVAGPTAASGQYYGVFLGEPPKGFPSEHLSSEPASPGRSSHSGSRSVGTSAGSVYGSNAGHSNTRSQRSSVAFPATTVVPAKQEPSSRSRNVSAVSAHSNTVYHTVRADSSAAPRSSVVPAKAPQPTVMPPSALKRERRSTLSTYSGSSGELPAADLRYLCKFAMGSIDECLRRVSFH